MGYDRMEGPFEVWKMPAGYEVFYRPDPDHTYWAEAEEVKTGWKGKGRVIGVSSAAKVASLSADGLMDWASQQTLDGCAELVWKSIEESDGPVGDSILWLSNGNDAWQTLRANEMTWRHRRQARADQGSIAHNILERALTQGIDTAKKAARPLKGDAAGFAQAAIKFVDERKPETCQVEQVVYSKKHNLAGRFDARVRMGGAYWLLDAKTSKRSSVQRSEAFSYQLAAYEMCLAECAPDWEVTRTAILRLDKDGTYELHPGCATVEDFLAGLDHLKNVKAVASKLRRVAKEAA